MNRTLKRPMFRKGGTPNEGIMSGLTEPRQGMQTGGVPDSVGGLPEALPQQPGILTRIKDTIFPPTGKIVSRAREVQQKPFLFEGIFDAAKEGLEFRTRAEADEFLEANPDFINPIKILETGETMNIKTEEPEVKPEVEPEVEPKINKSTAESDDETIKKYMDMFETVLGGDEDELNRQKYLQLAQFGTNLLAQPGGDLTAAIGRAATPSVAELGKIEARERSADREIKALGLQAALKQLDPTRLEQTVRYLQKEMPGVSKEKLINMAIAGSTGKGSTQESRITTNAAALETTIGIGPGLKAARAMELIGKNYAEFSQLPEDKNGKIKADTPDGLYYDKKGNLSIIDKGVKSDIKIGSTKTSSK
tara:strand:- start:4571 stop:5662 length:1092 start_codon:yes stop_codon:yes gene_type:complete